MWCRFPKCRAVFVLIGLTLSGLATGAEQGRILATGGLINVEGAGGGGLLPWSTLAGLSTDPGTDWLVGSSHVQLDDYAVTTVAITGSWNDRAEWSLARSRLDIDLAPGSLGIEQTIIGGKWRLAGDLIYGKTPQLTVGVQAKWLDDDALARAIGAKSDFGLDFYLGASRLVLDGPFHRNWLVAANVRASKANELGFLGFGGDEHDDYRLSGEFSTALFLNPNWAVGAEFRHKPDNLHAIDESNWLDGFVAWFPNKRVNVALAYVNAGTIAGKNHQDGLYVSVNVDL